MSEITVKAKKLSVEKLVALLEDLSVKYYTAEPAVTDDEYDNLLELLKSKDPKNKYLKKIGYDIKKNSVKLPYPLPSLNKIKEKEEKVLDRWLNKYKGPYLLSDKLDGHSLLFVKGEVSKLYTRGGSLVGKDTSRLIPYLFTKEDLKKIPNDTAIRGELIISKKKFKKISSQFKSARNALTSIVMSKVVDKDLVKLVDFVSYRLVHPKKKYSEQITYLKSLPLKVVKFKKVDELTDSFLSSYLDKRKKKGKYELDGIVVINDGKYTITSKNPKHAFAYKKISGVFQTKVVKVIWDISKHNYMNPKLEIEPVVIDNVEITYVTAHNAKFIEDNKIGKGAIIEIIRSGDVIPKIFSVIKPAKKADMPTDIEYEWNKSGVDILTKNEDNDRTKKKKIDHFFTTLGVKNVKLATIDALYDNGYTTIKSFIRLDPEEVNVKGFGEKKLNQLRESIDEVLEKGIELHVLMAASLCFGRGLGVRKSKLITDAYPNIMNEKWTSQELFEKLMEIKGFSEITANSVVDNFVDFKEFYKSIKKLKIKIIKKSKSKTSKLNNQKIVFTGFRDKQLQEKIEELGGKVTTTVSKNTTILIYDSEEAETTSKFKKAKELGVTIIKKSKFESEYL